MTFKDIPAWFWMGAIALVVVPISFSIFKNGVHLKAKNKLVGEVELDADEESAGDKGVAPAENKPVE